MEVTKIYYFLKASLKEKVFSILLKTGQHYYFCSFHDLYCMLQTVGAPDKNNINVHFVHLTVLGVWIFI